ncbi:MAG: hypothetical protein BWY76_00855 [bacterium ADurb.Bin429]|nr:MAG: hypothetical protein BWY76_00855 [bacterium ADurb.Bin429]
MKISEPTVIERADGSLLILCRSTMGRLFTAASTDGGAHWTTLAPSTIASKTAPPYMKRISDGRLILLLNPPTPEEIAKNRYVPDVRTTLQLLISRDDGATWSAPFMLAHDGVNGYCYPAVLELRQSKELLIFCSKTPETISSAAYVLLRLPVPSA